jgi:hypothetical protein
MPELEDRFQKDANIVSRQIAGEMILVPIRQKVGDLENIYTLNDTAARAWDLLDGRRSLSAIRDQILTEFEVNDEEAGQDLVELIAKLEALGAVSRVH